MAGGKVPIGHEPTLPDGHDTVPGAAEPAPAPISPGTQFGRYQIRRLLGRGGMGAVYEATDLNLRRQVALKVLLPTKSQDDEGTARMLREARAMAALHHPNVILIYDVGVHEEQVFLAMQLVDGQTLRGWLTEKRPTPAILEVLYRAGRGLAAAHAAGLVHRDFKPDNVLVSSRGTARVTDFGLARDAGERVSYRDMSSAKRDSVGVGDTLTRTGAVVGTPAYMAPEQARGARCDARADLFSFCVTAWEALYGQRPFAGATWDELYVHVMSQELVPTPNVAGISRSLRAALQRGLSAEPQHRFASMDELLEVFREAIAAPRARRRFLLVAAVGTLAIAGTAGVMALREHRDRDAPVSIAASSPQGPASTPQVPTTASPRTSATGSAAPVPQAERFWQHNSDLNYPTRSDRVFLGQRDAPSVAVVPNEPRPLDSSEVTRRPPSATKNPPAVPHATDKAGTDKAGTDKAGTRSGSATVSPPGSSQTGSSDSDVHAAKLEVLRERQRGLVGRRQNRSLLVSDIPQLPRQMAAVEAAFAARDVAAAASALDAAEALIDGVTIDGTFVSAKHARLNAQLQALHLSQERLEPIMDMLRAEVRAYQAQRYTDANVILNQIAKALVSDADAQ